MTPYVLNNVTNWTLIPPNPSINQCWLALKVPNLVFGFEYVFNSQNLNQQSYMGKDPP